MRIALAGVLIVAMLALTSAARAAPAGEADYRAANEAFLAGAANGGDYVETYGARVMKNLDGKWAVLVTAPYGGAFMPFLERSCEVLPVTIKATSDRTFVLTKTDRKGAKFDTVFTQMAGNMFGQYTEPDALFEYFGLKEKDIGNSRSNLVRNLNGIASVIRYSEGILVIQTNYNIPALYGRCS